MSSTKNASEHPSEFVKFAEARRRLGISRTKLYELLANGDFPGAKKLGGEWIFHWPTVVAYWTGCQPPGTDEE